MAQTLGEAIVTALSLTGLPTANAGYILGSSCTVRITAFDTTGLPLVPAAIAYRIDDVLSGLQLLGWTTATTPQAITEVLIPGNINEMVSQSRPWETHQLTVRVSFGGLTLYATNAFSIIAYPYA
jgi:hypothetical protein